MTIEDKLLINSYRIVNIIGILISSDKACIYFHYAISRIRSRTNSLSWEEYEYVSIGFEDTYNVYL